VAARRARFKPDRHGAVKTYFTGHARPPIFFVKLLVTLPQTAPRHAVYSRGFQAVLRL
jgi:hypothetical protein